MVGTIKKPSWSKRKTPPSGKKEEASLGDTVHLAEKEE